MIKVIIVGCGDRSCVYSEYAYQHYDCFEFVGAVDPDENRLKYVQDKLKIPQDKCYKNIDEVLKQGKIADCIINGTMDNIHYQTSIPFLKQGYDMLLEKPVVNNEKKLLEIRNTANKYGCKLLICHVLRYSPFYKQAKQLILDGAIGEIVNIETSERVGVAHNSISYIRGKWNNEDVCGSSMLLAKCCHDLDLICWLNNATVPEEVVSFGGRDFITPKKAPKGAGNRCLVDCPNEVREKCIYDAKSIYLDNDYLPWYPWQCLNKNYQDVTLDEKVTSLETSNPHGECAFKINANVVDHQSVMIKFKNGSLATHTMVTTCARKGRNLYIQGTKGEIEGWAGDGKLYLRTYNKSNLGYDEKEYSFLDKNGEMGGHFGGDKALVHDFMNLMINKEPSISCTSIDDSILGHMCVYAADESRKNNTIIQLKSEEKLF